ncbi:MAG: Ku protein [Acidimicrobiia bacterium]
MPQAIWTGSVSFGLVTVPVRLVSATKSLDVRFHQLDAGSGARVRQKRVSEQTGDEVPFDQIVKGYELEPGRYVVIEPDELSALAPKASRQIEIEDFVDLVDIDPVYFEHPYFLVPDKEAAKAYRLLADVMQEQGKVAIGRFVMRSKETLVAIRAVDGVLVLETMRYADEVLAPEREGAIPEPVSEPTEREMEMARQLVSSLSTTFDPDKYHDEYREELLALIDRKAAGEEIIAPAAPEEPAKVIDLMAALEASLARTGAKVGSSSAARAAVDEDGEREDGASARRRAKPRAATAKRTTKAAAKKAVAKKTTAKRARKSA